LEFDRILDDQWNTKDGAVYRDWTPTLIASAHTELSDFVREGVFKTGGGLKALLTSTTARIDVPLGKLYGVDAKIPDGGSTVIDLPLDERGGLFTRIGFLASHAREINGSPPLRGHAITSNILCITFPDPPDDVDLSNPATAPDARTMTNRELFERRVSPTICRNCHSILDPIAYPLEAYDGIGAFRTTENGKSINTAVEVTGTDIDGHYDNFNELSLALSGSPSVHSCVATHWLTYALGRTASDDADGCVIKALSAAVGKDEPLTSILKRVALSAALAN
jgi:Protein of unknown function (DUF1588)/Protein of unknown function (DUF1585)/Protein of unknown function (DUF1592)